MPQNRLADTASPYLLQHKDNPVDWWPWGPEALAEAHRTGKPILLSVGYAACHWCHVMAHESFEDAATAHLMNRLFVNIKVDREERPDVDSVYMAALHALGEQGGWPLTMFLTSAAEPFWGGTYFPREARYGRPAFADVLQEVARVHQADPARIRHNTAAILARLKPGAESGTVPLDTGLLDAAADRLLDLVDPVSGGTRGAPKFPNPPLIEFLWRSSQRTGRAAYRDAAVTTLRSLCRGGIYDHLGGGFARYSVDAEWLVPHFEKMLYDNAQLLERLTAAWAFTGEEMFGRRIEETVGWLLREMQLPAGGFASSLDADSEGEEGRFYVWSRAEIEHILGTADAAVFAAAYDVRPEGNWEGRTILNRLGDAAFPSGVESELARMRQTLLAARARRVRPGRDDKVLADWNGLAVAGLARAARAAGRPDWLDAAEQCYRFIAESMWHGGRLHHAWRNGRLGTESFASDYAAYLHAALALYQARPAAGLLADAERCTAILDSDYATPDGGFFLTSASAVPLVSRPVPWHDEAVPSANALIAAASARLWSLTGDPRHRRRADTLLAAAASAITANVYGTTGLLSALDQAVAATDLVIVIPPGRDAEPLVAAARRLAGEATTLSLVASTEALPKTHPAAGKTAILGRATAYLCRGAACSLPVTEPDALLALLSPGPQVSPN